MSVALVRVDARLVHGQVLECWVPSLDIEDVVVVDTAAAHDDLTQMAMRLALPADVRLRVLASGEADWQALFSDPRRAMVLVRDIETATEVDAAADLASHHVPLNVGVVQHSGDRREITPAVHLSASDLEALTTLDAHGVTVEVRGLPDQPPLNMNDVRHRFARAD